jgi:ABC-type nickel/cobalt efflux system permease component RcnA
MYQKALPFLGVIAIVLTVLFCGVSALAAWRQHQGHAEGGFVIVSAICALMCYQSGRRLLRTQKQQ